MDMGEVSGQAVLSLEFDAFYDRCPAMRPQKNKVSGPRQVRPKANVNKSEAGASWPGAPSSVLAPSSDALCS